MPSFSAPLDYRLRTWELESAPSAFCFQICFSGFIIALRKTQSIMSSYPFNFVSNSSCSSQSQRKWCNKWLFLFVYSTLVEKERSLNHVEQWVQRPYWKTMPKLNHWRRWQNDKKWYLLHSQSCDSMKSRLHNFPKGPIPFSVMSNAT